MRAKGVVNTIFEAGGVLSLPAQGPHKMPLAPKGLVPVQFPGVAFLPIHSFIQLVSQQTSIPHVFAMLSVRYHGKGTDMVGRTKRIWTSRHNLVPSFKDHLKCHLL